MLEVEDNVVVCAVRYALGRSTYVTAEMQQVLTDNWSEISPGAKQVIRRDINRHRASSDLGDSLIDAPGWLAILNLPFEDGDNAQD